MSEYVFLVRETNRVTLTEYEKRYLTDDGMDQLLRAAGLPKGEFLYIRRDENGKMMAVEA